MPDPGIWRDGFVCGRQINKVMLDFCVMVSSHGSCQLQTRPGPANTERIRQHLDICRLCHEYNVLYFVSLINYNIIFFLFLIFSFCELEKPYFSFQKPLKVYGGPVLEWERQEAYEEQDLTWYVWWAFFMIFPNVLSSVVGYARALSMKDAIKRFYFLIICYYPMKWGKGKHITVAKAQEMTEEDGLAFSGWWANVGGMVGILGMIHFWYNFMHVQFYGHQWFAWVAEEGPIRRSVPQTDWFIPIAQYGRQLSWARFLILKSMKVFWLAAISDC